ncbi:MAG: hypothetical protein HYZ62_00540 [Candidatus Andersenbacteria bacterium]|nr:hypothetical protein [Candidatus Andersenbacteria bacterium]
MPEKKQYFTPARVEVAGVGSCGLSLAGVLFDQLFSGEETLSLFKETLIIVYAVGVRDHFFAQDRCSRNHNSSIAKSPSSPQENRSKTLCKLPISKNF